MKSYVCLVCVLLGMLVQSAIAEYQPNFDEADKAISQWMSKGYYEGATFIVMRDGQVLHERNFGNFDRQASHDW